MRTTVKFNFYASTKGDALKKIELALRDTFGELPNYEIYELILEPQIVYSIGGYKTTAGVNVDAWVMVDDN